MTAADRADLSVMVDRLEAILTSLDSAVDHFGAGLTAVRILAAREAAK